MIDRKKIIYLQKAVIGVVLSLVRQAHILTVTWSLCPTK